ncbi:MAG: HDOD domain-containing protein [Pseudomonadota bacterium]
MDTLAAYEAIANELRLGAPAFPTSAQVALRVRQALDDPDTHIDTATRLIQAEPVLAARVVAMANSVALNPYGRSISDVRTAISRLGFQAVRSLASALLAHQMAVGIARPDLRALADGLWEHTAHVASLAQVLARRVTHVDAEAALFAGILHEVGGFYLLWRAEQQPELVAEGFADWVDHGEATLGRALLDVLQVPDRVRQAIAYYWDGYLALPPTCLGDTLLLADELAPVASPLHKLGGRETGEGMTARIDLLVGQETLHEILAESARDVASLIEALRFD